MPRVVVNLKRTAETRSHSKSSAGRPSSRSPPPPASTAKKSSNSTTPNKSSSKKQTPSRGPKSSENPKLSQITKSPKNLKKLSISHKKFHHYHNTTNTRTFFTVSEDNQILQYFNKNNQTHSLVNISHDLSTILSNHTAESIRVRLRRVLLRLREVDLRIIEEENKVQPDGYLHFSRINLRGRRTITHVNSLAPKIAGSTLTREEKRILRMEQSREKRIRVKAFRLRRATGRGPVKVETSQLETYTTDQLFRFRDRMEIEAKEKEETYKTMLRKRNPKKRSSSRGKVVVDSDVEEVESEEEMEDMTPSPSHTHSKSRFLPTPLLPYPPHQSQSLLSHKLQHFLSSISSTTPEAIQSNTSTLIELIDNFSTTFDVSKQFVLNIILKLGDINHGEVNADDIRLILLKNGKIENNDQK